MLCPSAAAYQKTKHFPAKYWVNSYATVLCMSIFLHRKIKESPLKADSFFLADEGQTPLPKSMTEHRIDHAHQCENIDPWITGNPSATVKLKDIRVQYVLLTHGHADHIADAVAIARRNNATIIAVYELATYLG